MDWLRSARVLEVGRRLGVASAGLALAALGADVVQVRLPGRSLPRAEATYYDRGRHVIEEVPSTGLGALASLADVVLTDVGDDDLAALALPIEEADLRAGDRAQVLVAVRSLGRSGPNRDFRMTDLTEWASSGLAYVTRRPRPSSDERYVPVLPPGAQPQCLAGLAAATAVLVGLRWARRTRTPVVADVSVQEAVAAILHGIIPMFVWNGVVTGHPSTPSTALGMLLPASDGDVYIRTLDPRQWDALMEWVGDDAIREIGSDPDSRLANNDALVLLMGEWTSTRRRHELVVEGQRRRIPIALPRSVEDVLAWQHLRARGVWRQLALDGAPVEVPRLPLIEPASWPVTAPVKAETVALQWRASV